MSSEREPGDAAHPEGFTVKTRESRKVVVLTCGGHSVDLALGELHDGVKVRCPCGGDVSIELSGIDDLKRSLEEIEKSVDGANRSLARLGIAPMKITID